MLEEPEMCASSSRSPSPFREESGDDELSILPRHTKVIDTGLPLHLRIRGRLRAVGLGQDPHQDQGEVNIMVNIVLCWCQDSDDAGNPGNNLYVTGLSTRVTERGLEKYFSKEGKVLECQLVIDHQMRESCGFGFVTMESIEGAEGSMKYLNCSVFEGRLITVGKAKRKREGHQLLGSTWEAKRGEETVVEGHAVIPQGDGVTEILTQGPIKEIPLSVALSSWQKGR